MAQLLHSGFDEGARDCARAFLRLAPEMLDIDALIDAFGAALGQEQATGHCCTATDGDAQQVVLSQSGDAGCALAGQGHCVTFPIDLPDDDSLSVTIFCSAPPDRHRLARLHLLAVVYANHVATLMEAGDEDALTGALTPVERHCLQLALAGLSHMDIGEQLDRSAPAVGIHLRRAAARLNAGSVREACTIALDRGMLHRAA